MVLYVDNSISFSSFHFSDSDTKAVIPEIIPETLQYRLNSGIVSDKTNNQVLTKLYQQFIKLGGFETLDIDENKEIEGTYKNRIKKLYRRIRNRHNIHQIHLENDRIEVIWKLLVKIMRNI